MDVFQLWCWRRPSRVSWTARRSSQSILKEINSIFIGRTDAEAEAPVLWLPDAKSLFIGKDPDAGKDWRQEEKGLIEDEMVRLYQWLNEHEFEQTLGDSGGQRGLACYSPWGHSQTQDWTTNNYLNRRRESFWKDLAFIIINKIGIELSWQKFHIISMMKDWILSLRFRKITKTSTHITFLQPWTESFI